VRRSAASADVHSGGDLRHPTGPRRPRPLTALRAAVLAAALAATACTSNVRTVGGAPAGLAPDVVAFVRGGPAPTAAGHPLAWIRTATELRPEDAAPGRADARIAEIVAAQHDLPIERVDVPVDLAPVERMGRTRTGALEILPPGFADGQRDGDLLAGECVAWRAGTVWIAVPDDSPMSELCVWFVLRALTLLRHRYPEAWSALFEGTSRAADVAADDGAGTGATRRIAAVLVAFDTSPTSIAASITAHDAALGTLDSTDGDRRVTGSRNVAVLLIHPGRAAGDDPHCGSAAIYKSGDRATDFLRYMSDGLVESLVHEMLHVYVDFASATDPACRFLSTSPARAEGARDAWVAAEECVVMNTSLAYFARKGGLSAEVRSYYAYLASRWCDYARTTPATLEHSVADVMSLGVSGETPADDDFARTLRLRVLDPPADER
jgi:hypothetical protein